MFRCERSRKYFKPNVFYTLEYPVCSRSIACHQKQNALSSKLFEIFQRVELTGAAETASIFFNTFSRSYIFRYLKAHFNACISPRFLSNNFQSPFSAFNTHLCSRFNNLTRECFYIRKQNAFGTLLFPP